MFAGVDGECTHVRAGLPRRSEARIRPRLEMLLTNGTKESPAFAAFQELVRARFAEAGLDPKYSLLLSYTDPNDADNSYKLQNIHDLQAFCKLAASHAHRILAVRILASPAPEPKRAATQMKQFYEVDVRAIEVPVTMRCVSSGVEKKAQTRGCFGLKTCRRSFKQWC
jgi:hypothetical protein